MMQYYFAFAMLALLSCTPTGTTNNIPQDTTVNGTAPKPGAAIVPSKILQGSAWRVETLNGVAANSFNSREPATLEFASGNASGSSGCNSFGGLYLQVGVTLFVGRIMSTEMGCPGTQETTLYRLLSGPVDTSFAPNGRLHLSKKSDKAVLARSDTCQSCRQSNVPSGKFVGLEWQIVAINGATPVDLNIFKNNQNYVVKFANDRFQLRAGCNFIGGTYRREDDQLFTTMGPSTLIGCTPELQEQDRLMTAIFAGNPVFVLGPNMDMLLASEAGMIELQAMPSQRK